MRRLDLPMLAAMALLVALLVVVFIGSTPNSRIPMGTRYRWSHSFSASSTALTIRFPSSGSAIPASYQRSARWVELLQISGTNPVKWAIYSPAFPAGVDTVWTDDTGRSFTFGGCRIDSLIVYQNSGTPNPACYVWATD